MNFPDRIFAIGGAGKAIALELLQSDWVLEELLEPRPNPPSLTVTIIDTAEGEENSDRETVREIRERISQTEADLRDASSGRTGTIDVEYKLITEDIHLSGSIDLLGDDAVPRIAAGNGMKEKNWWIKDRHINENLDFAKGVVRKRGLGKAIYYKAYAEDDQISSYIDLPQKGKVAILAGLGGGTGSGILLDMARHLQERQRTAEITLFGILPNHTEGIKENTNAFAALSELEYNALQDRSVFKDRVLVPIDPTDFDGKTGNRIQTEKYLKELDEAIIYLLSSYYNTQNLEDPFADTPDYAPFTIGIPQVLRYNVEAINEARDRFRDVLNTKEEALQTEDEIYSKIDRFLTKHYDSTDIDSGLRDLDRTDLEERLEKVKTWLRFDLFQELEYLSVQMFSEIVADAEEESSDVMEQIDIISGSIRAVDTTGQQAGTFVDTIDEHLAEVLEQDLTVIALRKEILERRKVIDDNRVRDAIEYLLGIGDGGAAPGVKLQRLEARLEDLEDQRERAKADLTETIDELETVRDQQSSEIERRTSDFVRDIESDVQKLQEIDLDEVHSNLATLQTDLDAFRQQVVNAASEAELEQIDDGKIVTVLNELMDKLERVGIDISQERREITGSLSELKRTKQAYLVMNQEESLGESILPWKSGTEEAKNDAHKDFRMQRNKLGEKGVFEVSPPGGNFAAEVAYDGQHILDELERTEQTLRQTVSNTLQGQVENVPQQQQERLETELSADEIQIDTVREVARSVFRQVVGETDELEAEKSDLEDELDDIEHRVGTYQPAIDLFQEVNNLRETWSTKSSAFEQELSKHDDDTEQSLSTESEEYVYVKNIKPNDIFRATGSDNLADSDMFANDEENQRLRSNLEDLAKNTRNQQYAGLKRRKISKDRARYDDLKIRLAVSSPAMGNIDPATLDFEDMFRGAYDLGASGKRVESPFTSWQKDIGGPWDISLSVFISGVFLDNIRKVVQADGYHAGYERRKDELGEEILVHHSYGLEDGYYVRRKELLNMEDKDDVGFYLQDDATIREALLEDYIEITDHTE